MAVAGTDHMQAQQVNTDSIYKVLDSVVANGPAFIRDKEHDIADKRIRFEKALTPAEQYEATEELYTAYRYYNNDSTLYYLFQALAIAEKENNPSHEMMARLRIGHQYVVSGYFTEAHNYLISVRPNVLNAEQRATFYHYWSHYYRELETFTIDEKSRQSYRRISKLYRDSVEAVSKPDNAVYFQRRCIGLCAENRYEEAMRVNKEWEHHVTRSTLGYSLMAYYRSEIYGNTNQKELQKYWLALAAENEVECCDMNHTALWKLAQIVADEGDLERGIRYLDFSWASISQFSTHKRSWVMAPIMSDIYNDYQTLLTRRNNQFRMMTIIVGLLAIFLLCALFYALRERKLVLRSQQTLQQTNNRLDLVNRQILDSNRLKDNYLREFLQLCSTYISKLDSFRSIFNRRLHANQIKDLIRMTESDQLVKEERDELMVRFDKVFLRLFPTFVQDFNNLLQPEARITPKNSESLNTVLRIFALVRLGIDESSKIAEFLNYTPNSIYNYRSRIKNMALCERNLFEEEVKLIGVPRETHVL